MKKLFCVLVIAASFAACNSSTETSSTDSKPASTDQVSPNTTVTTPAATDVAPTTTSTTPASTDAPTTSAAK